MSSSSNVEFTQLPMVPSSKLTDMICAVQGGVSVQESLQQIFNLNLANTILTFAGNPNGNLAGTIYQLCWDSLHTTLYICTTTGSSTTAIWSLPAVSGSGTVTSITAGKGLAGGTITSAGTISASNQCVFAAQNSVAFNSVTGDGTLFLPILDTAPINIGGNYSTSTGLFTAPLTGNYFFTGTIYLTNFVTANNFIDFELILTGGTEALFFDSQVLAYLNGGQVTRSGSIMVNMDAGDTANLRIAVGGNSSKNINVLGTTDTRFSGYIIN